jgi:RNA polymerase sigma-70 factor (ECF subfamily)
MRVDELAQRRFTHLYEQHYWSVLRFLLRRLGEEPRSRDLTAEVFVVAWRRLDELPDPVLPWLYGVARRVLANEYRSQGRQDRLHERLAGLAVQEDEDLSAERIWVVEALHRLSDADQEVLRLSAWEDLSGADIAAVLNCSNNAAAVRLHRARQRLRALMSQDPDTPDDPHAHDAEADHG